MNKFWKIIVLSLAAVNAQAEDCRTDLTGSDRYKDLSGILSCLSNKIKSMETEINSLKSSKLTGSAPQGDPKCGSAKTEAFIASIYPVMTGQTVKVKFTIENITGEPLFLVWNWRGGNPNPALSDDKYGIAAVTNQVTGLPGESDNEKEASYEKIAVGQIQAVGLTFDTNFKGYKINDQTHANVTMSFLRFNKGKVDRMTASPCALMKVVTE